MTHRIARFLAIAFLLWSPAAEVLCADEVIPPASPSLATYAAEEQKFQEQLLLKMQRPVDWQIEEETLSTLTERLKKELDCDVLLDIQAFEDLGIDPETSVKGNFNRISLQLALEFLLRPQELDWTIQGRALVLTTQEEHDSQLIVRVYDVRGLVVAGNFGHDDFESLIDPILSTVASDTWGDNGGGEADIRPFHVDDTYALIISQSFRVHLQIEKLLNDLRKLRGPKAAAAESTISREELKAQLKLFGDEPRSREAAIEALGMLELGTKQFEYAVGRSNGFSFDLFRKAAIRDRNQLVSGYGAREMLSLASYGAGGETWEQFAKVLRLPSTRRSSAVESLSIRSSVQSRIAGNELSVGNSIWISRDLPLLPKYQKLAEVYMEATVNPVNFGDVSGTVDAINGWAAARTRNRIKDAVDAEFVSGSDPCMLTNVVYFLGGWRTKFERENTKPREFRLASGKSVQVPTMKGQFEARAGLDEETGTTIGELFYGKRKSSMVILLPIDRKGALEELEESLTHEKLQEWLKQLRDETVNVELPKFRFEGRCELQQALAELGLRDAFNPTKADFSGITGGNLFLRRVRQVTYIRVDETGTEAAAFTGGGFFGGSRVVSVSNFVVDRPFLFLIRDVRTGCILFVGRVVDPRADQS